LEHTFNAGDNVIMFQQLVPAGVEGFSAQRARSTPISAFRAISHFYRGLRAARHDVVEGPAYRVGPANLT